MGKNKNSKAKASGKATEASNPKATKGANKAAAAAADAAEDSEAAAAGGEAEAAGTDYLSRLKPEEQEKELKKREEREKKAQLAKKKEEEDKQWREWQEQKRKTQEVKEQRVAKKEKQEHEDLLKRAKAEGVLGAEEYEDGCWYVTLGPNTWRMVEFPWWCKYCEASLNPAHIGSHLEGERHRKALQWQVEPTAGPAAAKGADAKAAKGAGSASASVCQPCAGDEWKPPEKLEPWQELDAWNVRCKACNKVCNGVHEYTDEHNKRVEDFMWRLEAEGREYPSPSQPWLAWVSDPSFGEHRYLKCLLCKKWVQDNDTSDMSSEGYDGNHGDAGPNNQKDHKKKLNNLEYYLEELAAEKQQFHPLSSGQAAPGGSAATPKKPTPAPWATAASSPSLTETPVRRAAPPGARPAPPQPGGVPSPKIWASSGATSSGAQVESPAGSSRTASRWGAPGDGRSAGTTPVIAERPNSAEPTLPPGWQSAHDGASGKYYYYNTVEQLTQWDRPTMGQPPQADVEEEC